MLNSLAGCVSAALDLTQEVSLAESVVVVFELLQ